MLVHSIKFFVAPLVLAALGGCSTYPASRPAFAYYTVPCSTPGAFVAEPIVGIISPDGAPASSPAPSQPTASVVETGTASQQTCMIAAPIGQARYSAGYSGRGYYDPYGYGFGPRYYGSIGIGLYGGGHGRRPSGGHGSRYGGGHQGGSHGGHGNH